MPYKLIFSKIQKAILKGLFFNKSYAEIAKELRLSTQFVKVQIQSIFSLAIFKDAIRTLARKSKNLNNKN